MQLYLSVGTVSQTVRSGNGPYKEKHHARPALLTVFSITQSDHLIAYKEFMLSRKQRLTVYLKLFLFLIYYPKFGRRNAGRWN